MTDRMVPPISESTARELLDALQNIVAFDQEVGIHDEINDSTEGPYGVQTEALEMTMAQARAAIKRAQQELTP
jgi:hypothetical protein